MWRGGAGEEGEDRERRKVEAEEEGRTPGRLAGLKGSGEIAVGWGRRWEREGRRMRRREGGE